jgi:hypothetical protein
MLDLSVNLFFLDTLEYVFNDSLKVSVCDKLSVTRINRSTFLTFQKLDKIASSGDSLKLF